jgi:N-acylneuraminate cytidylyltransferase
MNMPKKEVRVLGIIPARGGSTSIKFKNIADVGGRPLIAYSIDEAKKSKLLDAFIVSTDSKDIAKVARSCGADVPFIRPKKTAEKYSAEIEYQQHALAWIEKHRGWKPEIVVIIKATSPLRPASDIDRVIKTLRRGNFSMVRTVAKPRHHPYRTWTLDAKTSTLNLVSPPLVSDVDFSKWGADVPRQRLPNVYFQNGATDAIWAGNIKKGVRAVFAGPIGAVVVKPYTSVDIDEPADLEYVSKLFQRQKRS